MTQASERGEGGDGPSDAVPRLYQGTGRPVPVGARGRRWPQPPAWRAFGGSPALTPPPEDDESARMLGSLGLPGAPADQAPEHEVRAVNLTIALGRPLLVTGPPGTGKSALAYRIARELGLGRVLRWRVTGDSTAADGLYSVDQVRRLQGDDAAGPGAPIRLGPLGTALLPWARPRALVIDDLQAAAPELPGRLLECFETGGFTIPELSGRDSSVPATVATADPGAEAVVVGGRVGCRAFPVVVVTGESDLALPVAFVRRCLRLVLALPETDRLVNLVRTRVPVSEPLARELVQRFLAASSGQALGLGDLFAAAHLAWTGDPGLTGTPEWAATLAVLWGTDDPGGER